MKRSLVVAVIASILGTLCLYFQSRWHGDSESRAAHLAILTGGVIFVASILARPIMTHIQRIDVPELDNEETFFHVNWVTYPLGWDLVGGALYLTSKRLLFSPCLVNFHKVNFSIRLSNITDTRIFRLRFELWSRLAITDRSGKETVFIVGQPKIWAEKIRLAREGAKS